MGTIFNLSWWAKHQPQIHIMMIKFNEAAQASRRGFRLGIFCHHRILFLFLHVTLVAGLLLKGEQEG